MAEWEQTELWERAVVAFFVAATYTAGEGWSLTLKLKREGVPWADTPGESYDFLTAAELLDVVDVVLTRRLPGR